MPMPKVDSKKKPPADDKAGGKADERSDIGADVVVNNNSDVINTNTNTIAEEEPIYAEINEEEAGGDSQLGLSMASQLEKAITQEEGTGIAGISNLSEKLRKEVKTEKNDGLSRLFSLKKKGEEIMIDDL